MQVDVNGQRLWFDVEGPALVPDGREMRERPTIVLLHGGPGSFDHSYLKPDFARLSDVAQIVYLDLPGHGRSEWGDPASWSFETCADTVRDFCDTLGIAGPVVYGHSLGGSVAMVYAIRHPCQARALVLQSAFARFDLGRTVEEFRRAGGDEVAAIVERVYGGDSASVTPEEWAPCWRLFGPWVVGRQERARTVVNAELNAPGLELLRRFDVLDQLARMNVRRWSAWASSTPSLRWTLPERSPTPCPGGSRSSRSSRERATSPGRTPRIATGRWSPIS